MQQLRNDIKLCKHIDEFAFAIDTIIKKPVVILTDSVLRLKFIGLDFQIIKHKFCKNEIALPLASVDSPSPASSPPHLRLYRVHGSRLGGIMDA